MDRNNFFIKSKATFKGCRRPNRIPDYISYDKDGDVSSEYWYTDKGVYRDSRHWSSVWNISKELQDELKRTYYDSDYQTRLFLYHAKKYESTPEEGPLYACGKVASCFWTLKYSKMTTCGFCQWKKFKKNPSR